MKTISDHMDFLVEPEPNSNAPCVSRLHVAIQKAQTATERSGVDHQKYWLSQVQSKCCSLIHQLSTHEDINRDDPTHNGPEMLEQNYNDLITFISGVGTSCGEVIDRLDRFEFVEDDRLRAKAGKS